MTKTKLTAKQLRKACEWAMNMIQSAGLDMRTTQHKDHLNTLEAVADRAEDVVKEINTIR